MMSRGRIRGFCALRQAISEFFSITIPDDGIRNTSQAVYFPSDEERAAGAVASAGVIAARLRASSMLLCNIDGGDEPSPWAPSESRIRVAGFVSTTG